ncbi:MAG: hypothetical protein AAB316_20690, partial [Bacteroidota bacterium]
VQVMQVKEIAETKNQHDNHPRNQEKHESFPNPLERHVPPGIRRCESCPNKGYHESYPREKHGVVQQIRPEAHVNARCCDLLRLGKIRPDQANQAQRHQPETEPLLFIFENELVHYQEFVE